MKEPTVSLVIPAYNEEKSIGECLMYAIQSSEGKFHEIIVVNNASTDNTKSIALSYDGVRVVDEVKKGLTMARQAGYQNATGELVAYIDADTRMPSMWLKRVMREFQSNSELGCLSGPYQYFDIGKVQQLSVTLYWYILGMPTYWIIGYMVVGGNFVIKKSVLDSMNGFDTTISFYGEDTNIARRASRFGKVLFKPSLVMQTSGRRLRNEGLFGTAWKYVLNFSSEVFIHKPITKEYKDFR